MHVSKKLVIHRRVFGYSAMTTDYWVWYLMWLETKDSARPVPDLHCSESLGLEAVCDCISAGDNSLHHRNRGPDQDALVGRFPGWIHSCASLNQLASEVGIMPQSRSAVQTLGTRGLGERVPFGVSS